MYTIVLFQLDTTYDFGPRGPAFFTPGLTEDEKKLLA
jgi:hypothetical protein